MCGIFGTTYTAAPSDMEAAIAAIRHRGPDGTGVFDSALVHLGHVRLAIIDVAGGAQPMTVCGGRFAVTYNGEIYNYRALREELESFGYEFRTQSDTEVLLRAYERWGEAMLPRLRGMFAFAIVDLEARRMLLARDPLGIKPLVYSRCGGAFSFSSEIQGLLAMPWVRSELSPNRRAIVDCLDFGYASSPSCAFSGISKLPPAHFLSIDLDRPRERQDPKRYWSFSFCPDESLSAEGCAELVDATLRESVKAHLVSDVPFGAFLSGGLDSSLVTSYMAELLDEPVKTFCIGFDSAEHNETDYARMAAESYSTQHNERILDEESLNLIPELVRHYGEPFSDPSAVPTWHVAKLAREQVPMVLTGDGGDELFAGYTGRYGEWMESLDPTLHPRVLRPPWKTCLRRLFSSCFPGKYPADPPFPPEPSSELLAGQSRYFSPHRLRRLLEPSVLAESRSVPEGFEMAFRESAGAADLSRAQQVDIGNYLPDDILTKVDIASMMHGLETRTPLVDIRVAEMACRLPWDRLFAKAEGPHRWRGKEPFRAILGKRFDDSFLNRKKMGFSIPLEKWLFGSAKAHDFVGDRLLSSSSPLRGWVRAAETRRIVTERASWQTWHLLVLAEWLDQNRF